MRGLVAYAAPLAVSAICLRLFDRIDIFALRVLGGSMESVAAYGVAQNLALGPGLFGAAFTPALIAALSYRLARGDDDGARQLSRGALRAGFLMVPLTLLTAGTAPELIALLFGPAYAAAAPLFAILLVGAAGTLLIALAGGVLVAAGKLRWTVALTAPLLLVAGIAHLVLIPRMGAVGAATVTTGTAIVGATGRRGRVAPVRHRHSARDVAARDTSGRRCRLGSIDVGRDRLRRVGGTSGACRHSRRGHEPDRRAERRRSRPAEALDTSASAAGNGAAMTTPAWSVIVPTYNRPHQLVRCIDALSRVKPPAGGFEVIIINDGGNEEGDAVRRAATGTATTVRYAAQLHAGRLSRATPALMAVGTWLTFTDDDCEPSSDWLQAFERAVVGHPDALAGGVVRNAVSDSMFSEASQLLAGFVADWFDGAARERFFTSNNIAVGRAAFLDAGGFDASFGTSAGEDREFCDRWTAQGRESIQVADAIVDHMHALSLRSFLRQHHGYGRGAQRFRHRRRAAGRPIRIDPSFYLASLRHAVKARPIARGVALAGCTALAHTAYAAGLARESWREKRAAPARVEHS
jgi:GT2 family glycosyltransferase